MGVDFVRKDLEVSFQNQRVDGEGGDVGQQAGGCECGGGAANVRMQLWDIAGQDRFARLTRAYFRRAKAAAIVCDVTRKGSFEAVRQWKHEIDTWASAAEGGGEGAAKPTIPVVLFANKSDLLEDTTASFLAGARMESVCRELGIVAWFVTSAKDGVNVEQGFRHLATLVASAELGIDLEATAEDAPLAGSAGRAAASVVGPGADALNDDDSSDEEDGVHLLGGDSLLCVWDVDQ